MTNVNDIPKVELDKAVALSVTFHRVGNQRDGDMNEVETSADKKMVRMVKKLFGGKGEGEDGKDDTKCKEYDAITSFDGKLYRWLCDQSVSLMGRRNVRLISRDAVPTIEAKLRKAANERQVLVDAFLKVYPLVVEAARTKLNGQYDASDYPSVERVASKFGMDWNYLALGIPENLPDEVKAAMQDKATKMWESAAENIRDGLRVGFVKLVEHLIEMLQPKADGKKQKFYDSNVTNILSFIDTLSQRNLTNDKALVEVAEQARVLIETHASDVEKVKSDADTKKAVIEGMSKVRESLNAMIGTEKRRKFDLD